MTAPKTPFRLFPLAAAILLAGACAFGQQPEGVDLGIADVDSQVTTLKAATDLDETVREAALELCGQATEELRRAAELVVQRTASERLTVLAPGLLEGIRGEFKTSRI